MTSAADIGGVIWSAGHGAPPWAAPESTSLGRLPMHAVTHRSRASLDGVWRFQLLPSPEAELGAEWGEIHVPGAWTMQHKGDEPKYTNIQMPFPGAPPEVPELNPTGVYRRTFGVPAEWGGRRVVLCVGAAESVVIVRVNGRTVGFGKDSHLASEFLLSPFLAEGDNELELVVVKWSDASYIEDQDQWWHGGLTRSVELYTTPTTYIADARITADYDPETGHGSLEVDVLLDGSLPESAPHVRARVSELGMEQATSLCVAPRPEPPPGSIPEGALDLLHLRAAGAPLSPELDAVGAAVGAFMFPADSRRVRLSLGSLPVDAWTAETPRLYEIEIELRGPDGHLLEVIHDMVGFRRVEIVGRELLVNGRAILIRGVNRHDFDPHTGRTVTAQQVASELSLLKRLGFNAIRTAHYPNDPAVLRLCDEYGIYVVAEANVEAHAHTATIADDPRYTAAIMDRVIRMARRDVNHPSVIIWSLGNETGYGPVHDAAAAWLRRFDPSRPIQYEGAIAEDWHSGQAATDIVCPMYAPLSALTAYAQHPGADRPIILCEYQHAMGNSNGSLDEYWGLFESTPGLQGGFIWELWDHGLDPDGDGRYRYGGDLGGEPHDGEYCIDGLLFPDRTPHPAMFEARALFSPLRTVADTQDGTIRLRNAQTFATTESLRVRLRAETTTGPTEWTPTAMPVLAPGETASIPLSEALTGPAIIALTISVSTAHATPWAPAETELAVLQARRRDLPVATEPPPAAKRPILDADGLLIVPLLATPPTLCFWRSPTDNDRSVFLGDRFRRAGLDRMRRELIATEQIGTNTTRTRSRYHAPNGAFIDHLQTITSVQDGYAIDELVTVPEVFDDLMRVGITFETHPGLTTASWLGLGPHETYPDRKASGLFGRWTAPVIDLDVPYLRPQENGGRANVSEFALEGEAGALRLVFDRPLQVSASHNRTTDLDAAQHWWELTPRDGVTVHLDVAHRGLGTASVGPDAATTFRFGGGTYQWRWTLTTEQARGIPRP